MQAEWQRLGFVLSEDALLLFAPDGTLAAYTDVFKREAEAYISHNTCVHPAYRSQLSKKTLFRLAESLAGQCTHLRTVSTRQARNTVLEDEDYTSTRWDWRMEIDLCNPPEAPVWPAAFNLRPFNPAADAQAVHAWSRSLSVISPAMPILLIMPGKASCCAVMILTHLSCLW